MKKGEKLQKDKTNYLEAFVSDAVEHGAKIVNTDRPSVYGSFFFPAILYPVNPKMRVYHEEQFGR